MSVFKVRATGFSSVAPQKIDEAEVRRALSLFADPARGIEFVGPPSWQPKICPGGDLDRMAEAVQEMRDRPLIYLRLNPVGLNASKCASDRTIIERRWLFLDIDPVKKAGEEDNPATDEEHERTRLLTEEVRLYLSEECGWPAPVLIDSGNGWYLLYRILLPNTEHVKAIIKSFVHSMSKRFSGDKGTIDPSIYNASRLAKLPGTMAIKGKCSDDRPYRMCRLVFCPQEPDIVSPEMIVEATAGEASAPVFPSNGESNGTVHGSAFKVKAGSGGMVAYVKKALDNECARVVLAQPGPKEGRNNALNRAAFSLGTLVGGGYLSRSEAEQRLWDAARSSGLHEDANCGQRGIESTIRSGLEAGMEAPRSLPEKAAKVRAADGPGPEVEEDETITIGANEIAPEVIKWLWYGRLPQGKLVTWAGQTGLGKSFLSCDIAARMSIGADIPFGGGECFPVSGTLMLNCEDGYADTIVPRLMEAGADLRMIRFMKTEKLACWTMAHLDSLERAIRETPDCRLVILDAASSFLGGVDDHKNSEFRQLLAPFVLRVQDWGVSVVFVTHFNKAGSHKVEVLDRVMGGVAWVSGVRVAAAFIKTPTPDEPERRMFVPLKSNICKKQTAITYRLVNVDGDRNRCRVEWLEEIDTTAEQAMTEALQGAARPRGLIAAEWLIEQFNVRREWSSEDLFTAGKHAGVSRNAIFEAKKQLSLPSARRVVSENGDVTYIWWVPEDWAQLRKHDEGEA